MVHLARQPHRNDVVSKTDGNLHSSEHDMEVEATYTHAFAHDRQRVGYARMLLQ